MLVPTAPVGATNLVYAPMRVDTLFARTRHAPDPKDPPEPEPDPKPKPSKPKPGDDPDPKPDDVQAKIDAAVASAITAERTRLTAEAQAAKEEADRKAAEAKGEWGELAKAEKSKREALEVEARRLRQSIALRDHLAEKHPEYVASAVDILPHVPVDADGEALVKAVETAAKDFIARNPREAKATAGAPTPRTPGRAQNLNIPESKEGEGPRHVPFGSINWNG